MQLLKDSENLKTKSLDPTVGIMVVITTMMILTPWANLAHSTKIFISGLLVTESLTKSISMLQLIGVSKRERRERKIKRTCNALTVARLMTSKELLTSIKSTEMTIWLSLTLLKIQEFCKLEIEVLREDEFRSKWDILL